MDDLSTKSYFFVVISLFFLIFNYFYIFLNNLLKLLQFYINDPIILYKINDNHQIFRDYFPMFLLKLTLLGRHMLICCNKIVKFK